MNVTSKSVALAVGGALALSVSTASFAASQNPFAIKALSSGYQVADADTKMKDGKCGEGKCSAERKKHMQEMKEQKDKSTEGKCSAEGNCSAEMKEKAAK